MKNEIVRFAVKVNNGSGCLFQPMTDEYSYVLTAKHIVQNQQSISVVHQYLGEKGEVVSDTLEVIGAPFLHLDGGKDAAILKVKTNKILPNLLRASNIFEKGGEYYLVGHPETRIANEFSVRKDHLIVENRVQHNYVEAKLNQPVTYKEIVGQSGGGIIGVDGGIALLAGIQKQMAVLDDNEQLSRINFMPIDFFDEIVEANQDELKPLYPPYIGSMNVLLTEIYPLNNLPNSEQRVQIMLRKMAAPLCDSFVPLNLLSVGDEMIIDGQSRDLSLNKVLWISFLEFLVLNQLVWNTELAPKDIPEIYKTRKLFFGISKHWTDLTESILKSDLSQIEKGGKIIVSCEGDNAPALTEIDLKDMVGNIGQVSSEEMSIHNTVQNYLEDLEVVHIFKFQNHILQNYKQFSGKDEESVLALIKDDVRRII